MSENSVKAGAESGEIREERWEIPTLDMELYGGVPCGERRDAAESRRRVLESARALFEERSVDAVSMHEIGREAGVGQGTLYRRYEHKGVLCLALLGESAQRFSEEIREHLEASDEPTLEQLEYFVSRLARFNEENAPLLGAIRDATGGERRPERYRNPFYGWLRSTVKVLLERAISEGEMPPSDVEYLADAILAPLNVDLYIFQRQELGMEAERLASALCRLLRKGLHGGS